MSDWNRVTRSKPCPICQRPDWCLIAPDGSAVICARIVDGSVKRCGEAGWLHRLRDSDDWQRSRTRTVRVKSKPIARTDLAELAKSYCAAVQCGELEQLAHEIGVTEESMRRLGVGWDGESWTFPMTNAKRAIVGIRRRFPDGRKLSVKGGHEGVFVPSDLSDDNPLLIAEGPTDCAALLDLGFAVIGRPSCAGGLRFIPEYARGRHAVIVADGDAPGQRGAISLASVLRLYCPSVRIITPPDGTKDARAWKCAGMTREDIAEAMERAPILEIKTHGR